MKRGPRLRSRLGNRTRHCGRCGGRRLDGKGVSGCTRKRRREERGGLTVIELFGWVVGVDVPALTVLGAGKVLLGVRGS